MMRARSTRFAGSVRDREISTSARRWSASTDNAIIRRAATMAPPAMPQCFIPHIAQIGYLDTTYRQLGIFLLALRAKGRLVIMIPFVDRIGAEWAVELFGLTAATERILVLREAHQLDGCGSSGNELIRMATRIVDYGG